MLTKIIIHGCINGGNGYVGQVNSCMDEKKKVNRYTTLKVKYRAGNLRKEGRVWYCLILTVRVLYTGNSIT